MSSKKRKPVPGIYIHYKGNKYRVQGVARHTETKEEVVVYQALYGDFDLWIRPLEMFMETVEFEGRVVPRFTLETPLSASLI